MNNNNLKDKAQLIGSILLASKNRAECANLILDLFTPKEILSVSERIEILKYLSQGKTQRQIAEKLDCAIVTVTRGNKIMNYGTGAARKVFKVTKS